MTTKAVRARAAKRGASSDEANNKKNKSSGKRIVKLRQEFDSLQKEMEIAEYAKTNGQYRKKLPRKQATARTKKRKLLEKQDVEQLAIRAPDYRDGTNTIIKNPTKSRRLRGSKAAIEDHVIEGSLVFRTQQNLQIQGQRVCTQHRDDKPQSSEVDVDEMNSRGFPPSVKISEADATETHHPALQKHGKEVLKEHQASMVNFAGDDITDDNDFMEVNGTEMHSERQRADVIELSLSVVDDQRKSHNPARPKEPPRAKKKHRHMYKMRNFQSFRMAQRHGDALSAHARGDRREAIEKLKQVAKDAPSAPQVYSSLGMVYEDMLQESRRRKGHEFASNSLKMSQASLRPASPVNATKKSENDVDDRKLVDLDPDLTNQLKLAEKAYGSYHVAAILCKKDFSLWVRAADSASDIADLYGKATALPTISQSLRKHYGSERRRWLSEAQRDYKAADDLKPPGIDIPAKLASMHMELGNLSEALTLLTDLKNRSGKVGGIEDDGDDGRHCRNEFEASYKAWLLYADLMLKIGHECTQWNRGVQTNDNYMFRRWLRKLSRVFDWQERRLQALALAFESAAGSKNTARFISWMRKRALAKASSEATENAERSEQEQSLRWHLDAGGTVPEHSVRGDMQSTVGHAEKGKPKTDRDIDHDEHSGIHSKRITTRAGVEEEDEPQVTEDPSIDDVLGQSRDQGGVAPHCLATVEPGTCLPMKDAPSSNTSLSTVSGKRLPLDEQNRSLPGGDSPVNHHFEQEKKLLLDKNSQELVAFDKTTRDMRLGPESLQWKDRQDAREALIARQSLALAALEREYQQQPPPTTSAQAIDNESRVVVMGEYQQPLSISASCRTVCMIASELMKHMYGIELYEGGTLVGEAVSMYLKERADWHDRRIASRKRLDMLHEKNEASVLFAFQEFSEVDDESDTGDDCEASMYLSDEEDLEGKAALLRSLRKGVLPPEIRVLLSLALIAEGGQRFVASKLAEAIDELEQESCAWLVDGSIETDCANDFLWHLFRRAMTEPLGRTSAYAFVADVLHRTGKEKEWSEHFHPYFQRHLETLKKSGLIDELLRMQGKLPPFLNFRKNQVVKSILGAARLELHTLESSENVDEASEVEGTSMVLAAVSSLTNVLHLVWNVEADGSLPPVCEEMLTLYGRSLAWLARGDRMDKLGTDGRKKVVANSRRIVSFLCGTPIPDFDEARMEPCFETIKSIEWSEFPVQSAWQPDKFKSVSLRVHNLCVACNVSLFSGWEPDEFSLRLLRRRHGDKRFGVRIEEGRVSGHLSTQTEEETSRQLDELYTLLPSFPRIDYNLRLAEVKKADWYCKEIRERVEANCSTPIPKYGEEDGISIFLAFSSACLRVATSCSDEALWNELVQAATSVLLPIAQFSLDITLWDSAVGEAASTFTGFDDWRLMADKQSEKRPHVKTPRIRKGQKAIEKKVHEWINGTDKPALQAYVRIPASAMLARWRESILNKNDVDGTISAVNVMDKLHKASEHLRACYTEGAVEKASLQLAVALLDVASHPLCYNPFVCLQQAAIFASQGCKAGNSDTYFRHSIPASEVCTPLEALLILGRADCLQSIYFPNEGAFLCSYVARVCSFHRDPERPELEWNFQWKLVAIYAYNVSVLIRNTVKSVLDKDMQKSFQALWDQDVVEELERGRLDASAWKRSLFSKSTSDRVHEGGEGDVEEGLEEESDLDDDTAKVCELGEYQRCSVAEDTPHAAFYEVRDSGRCDVVDYGDELGKDNAEPSKEFGAVPTCATGVGNDLMPERNGTVPNGYLHGSNGVTAVGLVGSERAIGQSDNDSIPEIVAI